jgi:membrane peptidoglycan carboxypeptidase
MSKKRSFGARLRLEAMGPRLRQAALIYVVSLAEALGEALMAAAGISSRLFNVPRWEPPLAPPPGRAVPPTALRPLPQAQRSRAGLPAGRSQRSRSAANGSAIEVRPTILPTAPSVAHRVVAGVRRELAQAREAETAQTAHSRARRDARGRRLRASAYIYGPNGPKNARGRYHRRIPGVLGAALPAAVKISLVMLLTAGAFLASSQAYIDYAADLPDAHAITTNPLPEDSLIYAANGTLLADVHPEGIHHYYEPLEKMGTYLPQATIAIEDANFWNEPGIDPGAMARAAWVDWRQKSAVQGASTITQQLVKLRLIGNKPSIDRKIKEAILALQVEHVYSKRAILEQYLNTIFYSNNSQGTLAAAKIYFHKDTKDLTLGEASMLAGIPQSPFYNSPFLHPEVAKHRQHDVLQAMVKQKMVTQDEADEAFAQDLSVPDHMFTAQEVYQYPAFTGWIVSQLKAQYGPKAAEGGGLRVATTINLDLQKLAQDTVIANVNANRGRNLSQGAQVSIDPRTGAVLTMVGSANSDRNGGQFNMATTPRSPGSAMKIFNYTAGIESGKFTMNTPIADTPTTIDLPGQRWQPKNYDLKYHGNCAFQACMGNSLNIPAVKVEMSLGVDRVVDMARRMGAPPLMGHDDGNGAITFTSDDPATAYTPSLTLGGYSETALRMATGAAVLGAQGLLRQPYGIASVKDSAGNEIFKADPAKTAKQVIDPKVAFIMEQIMSDDSNRAAVFGTGTPLVLNGRRAGAKTGTSEDFRNTWTVGYTPSLATAVWFGNPDSVPLTTGSDGIFVAAPAWHAYMQSALDVLQAPPSEWFAEPPGLGHALAGGKLIYLMPGTSVNQPAPPLPPNVHTSAAPNCTPPSTKPGATPDPNANQNQNRACPR